MAYKTFRFALPQIIVYVLSFFFFFFLFGKSLLIFNILLWTGSLPFLFSSLVTSVLSNSLQPYGQQPTRFLCPWESPGKNAGEGSHSLLQGIFPTQGSSLGLLYISCIGRQVLYHQHHLGSPFSSLYWSIFLSHQPYHTVCVCVCVCFPSPCLPSWRETVHLSCQCLAQGRQSLFIEPVDGCSRKYAMVSQLHTYPFLPCFASA